MTRGDLLALYSPAPGSGKTALAEALFRQRAPERRIGGGLGGGLGVLERPGVVAATDHASEGLLEGEAFDLRITNDGTVADMVARVEAFLAEKMEAADA